MPTDFVLPNLTDFVKNGVNAIYNATSSADTNNAIDNLLSKDAYIIINGMKKSRADLASEFQSEKFLEAGATVNFLGAVEVPASQDNATAAGSVGIFFNVTIQETIRVRVAPVSHNVTASLNVVIEQDPSIPPPPPTPIRGFFDARRVTALNLVIANTQAPINL